MNLSEAAIFAICYLGAILSLSGIAAALIYAAIKKVIYGYFRR